MSQSRTASAASSRMWRRGSCLFALILSLRASTSPVCGAAHRHRQHHSRTVLASADPNSPAEASVLVRAAKSWGSSFKGSSTWRSRNPCSAWEGVTCGDGNAVVQLDLSSKGLKGPLPAALGGLPKLISLNLERNNLRGGIPRQWSALTALEQLNLAFNRLSGGIPTWISSLASLTELNLGYNRLSGHLPDSITKLKDLQYLLAQVNSLTGHIPDLLPGLAQLASLDLSFNRLSGPLPPSLLSYKAPSPAPALQILNVTSNQLSGFVRGVERLPNLLLLDLSDNEFSGRIPSEWGDSLAPSDGVILLDQNYFVGTSVINSSRVDGGTACLRDVSVANSITGNCIDITLDSYTAGGVTIKCPPTPQKSRMFCVKFCNATAPTGACGGHGTCYFRRRGSRTTPTCVCDEGYKSPRNNPGVCVKA